MIIVSKVSFSTDKLQDIVTVTTELPDPPSYMTKNGPYVYPDLANGMTTLSFYKVDPSMLGEGLQIVHSLMISYFHVHNFQYEVTIMFDIEEASMST